LFAAIAQSVQLLGYRLGRLKGRGSIVSRGNIFSRLIVLIGYDAHPVYYVMGTDGCSPGREADHSPRSIAEVKNGGVMLPHRHTFS
jgi:hypothetical protein